MVAFESLSRALHFLHLLAAVVSVATCTHLLLRLVRHARRGTSGQAQVRVHARILAIAYVTAYGLGSLIYPTFRVRVRAELLDRVYPWASGLFEIKEHSATLVLVPVLAIYALSRRLDFADEADRRHLRFFGGLVSIVLAILVYNACVGWYLGTLRSV